MPIATASHLPVGEVVLLYADRLYLRVASEDRRCGRPDTPGDEKLNCEDRPGLFPVFLWRTVVAPDYLGRWWWIARNRPREWVALSIAAGARDDKPSFSQISE